MTTRAHAAKEPVSRDPCWAAVTDMHRASQLRVAQPARVAVLHVNMQPSCVAWKGCSMGDMGRVQQAGDRSQLHHCSQGVLQFLRGRAQRPYMALVLPGNESSLISECLKRRSWWRSIKSADGDDITQWNLWWGGNGQLCPFKRFNTGAPPCTCKFN